MIIENKIIAQSTSQYPSVGHSSITKLNDGRLFFTLELANSLSESAGVSIYGQYSTDEGETLSAPFQLIPIAGNEIQNTAESIFQRPDGTLIMVFYRLNHDALSGGLYLSKSTDSGVTWSTPVPIYNPPAVYLDPMSDRIIQLTDGRLVYPFSQWIPPTENPSAPNDRGSQLGWYKGKFLISSDLGETWTMASVEVQSVSGGNLVTQTGVYQFENTGTTAGQIVMYHRSRNGIVGFSYINSGFTAYTEQASTLVGNNQPITIKYISELRAIVALVGPVENPFRTKLNLCCSYDKGNSWFFTYAVESNPQNLTYAVTSPGPIVYIDGLLYVIYYKSSSTTRTDGWLLKSPVFLVTGFDSSSGTAIFKVGTQAAANSPYTTIDPLQIITNHTAFRLRAKVDAIPANGYAPLSMIAQFGGGQYSQTTGTNGDSDIFQVWDGNINLAQLKLNGFWTGKVGYLMKCINDADADGRLNTGLGAPTGSLYWSTSENCVKAKKSVGTAYTDWSYPFGMHRHITTTDATPTVIVSYSPPNNSSAELIATINVRKTDTNETASFRISRAVRRAFGPVTFPGTTVIEKPLNGDAVLNGITADFFPLPGDSWTSCIKVTGIVGMNLSWTVAMQILQA